MIDYVKFIIELLNDGRVKFYHHINEWQPIDKTDAMINVLSMCIAEVQLFNNYRTMELMFSRVFSNNGVKRFKIVDKEDTMLFEFYDKDGKLGLRVSEAYDSKNYTKRYDKDDITITDEVISPDLAILAATVLDYQNGIVIPKNEIRKQVRKLVDIHFNGVLNGGGFLLTLSDKHYKCQFDSTIDILCEIIEMTEIEYMASMVRKQNKLN